VPFPARHEWAKRISEFVLGYGLKHTTKFQQLLPPFKKNSNLEFGYGSRILFLVSEWPRMLLAPL
jgi:hypothetical protein